jgi:hypothetical protein
MKATVSVLVIRYNGQPEQAVGVNGDIYGYQQLYLDMDESLLDDITAAALKKKFGDSCYLGERPIVDFLGVYGGVTIEVEDFEITIE